MKRLEENPVVVNLGDPVKYRANYDAVFGKTVKKLPERAGCHHHKVVSTGDRLYCQDCHCYLGFDKKPVSEGGF